MAERKQINMKILLINPPNKKVLISRDMAGGLGFDRNKTMILPPLDLAYIAASLLKKDNIVKIIDAPAEEINQEETYKRINQYNPEVIISLVSLPSLEEDCQFLKKIKSTAKKIVKTGIAYPPILEEILKKSQADFCIYGECETIINKILEKKEKKSIAYLDKTGNLKMEEKHIIENLDKLPFPARDLLPNKKYRYPFLGEKITTIQTSRGCPFPCAYYCPYPLVQGKKWRARSPKNVIEEIKDIVLNQGIRKILFRDAILTLNKERTLKICNLIIKNGLQIKWWCETRINCLDFELMKRMKEAGCCGINVGIETGDPIILESQAKIGVDIKQIKTISDIAKILKVRLHFLIMLGLPIETRSSLYKTFRLIKNLNPDSLGITIVTPYPGTQLFEEAQKAGWIKDVNWSHYGGHTPVMETHNLTVNDLIKAEKIISHAFYLSKNINFLNKLRLLVLTLYFKTWSLFNPKLKKTWPKIL